MIVAFSQLIQRYPVRSIVASSILGLTVAAAGIYLTPLRLIPVLEPSISDVEARVIAEAIQADPDKFIFLDVRPTAVFNEVHAVGSKNAPLHTLYDLRHLLPKRGKTIVLICSGGRASGVGYSYLEHFGFFNVVRVGGGIEAWQAAGLPTASGPDQYHP